MTLHKLHSSMSAAAVGQHFVDILFKVWRSVDILI